MIKKDIKSWLIQWITILLVLSLWAVSYAAFTNFTSLQATSWETLTSTKWNDMVDAVQDEYLTNWTEVVTNKTWDWKPVYRKVLTYTSWSNSNWLNLNSSWLFSNADNCKIVQHVIYRSDWRNTTWEQNTILDTDIKKDCSSIWMQTNWQSYTLSRPVILIIEYTKTTD